MTKPRQADSPRRALPRRQQHHGVERPGLGQPHRLRLVRPLRPDRRARQVRLHVPRRGAAPARAGRRDLRPRRRRPAGHVHGAGRAGRGDGPPRADGHDQLDVQRAVRGGTAVRVARPPLRRAAPRGTSSRRGMRSPARTFVAAATSPKTSDTSAPRASSRRPTRCSTPGAVTRSSPTRTAASSSTIPPPGRSPTPTSTSTSAAGSTCRAARRAGRSSSRPATPITAANSPPPQPMPSSPGTAPWRTGRRSTPTSRAASPRTAAGTTNC